VKRILALSIVLAACSPQSEAANESVDSTGNTPAVVPAEPKPEAVPARIAGNFHGLWAENDAACGELTHPSRLTVTGNSLRYPAFVLAVQSVTRPTPNAFAVKGYSKQTRQPTEAHFSIDATGNILTDEAGGGTVRVRCT
jgi:hypothetical protein